VICLLSFVVYPTKNFINQTLDFQKKLFFVVFKDDKNVLFSKIDFFSSLD
jgi:hypothetical protein